MMSDLEQERWRSHTREHDLLEQAVRHAKNEIDRRLGDMNEMRHQIEAERGTLVNRQTYEARHDALSTRIGLLEQSRANIDGRIWAGGAILVLIELALRFVGT